MPTYTYRCRPCDAITEVVSRMDEAHPDRLCPLCGEQMGRAYSPPAITFKGSGFYSTS